MAAPFVSVENHLYPFAQSAHSQTKVIQTQYFKTHEQLQQKKKQIMKKSQLINYQSIIKLLGVTQKGMKLVYSYQFIPHSIESYLLSKWREQPTEIWTMTKKLFTKKATFELTLLTSYLGKMKIQTELGMQHLGISKDEKLKLYVNAKSKMGIKQEIQLIIAYNQNKQKILKELQQLYLQIQNSYVRTQAAKDSAKIQHENVNSDHEESFTSLEMRSQNKPKSGLFGNLQQDTSQSFLRQTRGFKEAKSQFRPRKMSTGNLQFSNGGNLFKTFEKPQQIKTPKAHKYSFQFGSPSDQSSFNQTSFASKQDEPSYSKSKSIRIELEQKQNLGSKKQRKDSYKVKITTVREYELGDNPNFFGNTANNQDDIFQYFAKRSKGKAQEEEIPQDPQKSQEINRKQTVDTNNEIPQPSCNYSPMATKQRKQSQNSISSKNKLLEQRIRQAKQRTNKALNLMKNFKK